MKKLLLFFCVLCMLTPAFAQGGIATTVRFGSALPPSGAKQWSVFGLTSGPIGLYMCITNPTCTSAIAQWQALGTIYPNAVSIQWLDASGTARSVLVMDGSNNIVLQGHPTQQTINIQPNPGTTCLQITPSGVFVLCGSFTYPGADYRASAPPGTFTGVPSSGKSAWGLNLDGNYYDCNNTTDPSATGTCLRHEVIIGEATLAGPTSAIANNTCATNVTATVTGTLATSRIIETPAASPHAATYDGLQVRFWPTANTVNMEICNKSGGSITPTALNWLVTVVP